MPVRSLDSSVFTWPDAHTVDAAVRRWAQHVVARHAGVLRVGYFGSYARGDWGVGSDLDLVVVVELSDLPAERRAAQWDITELPVPADILIYTQAEWQALDPKDRLPRVLARETVWVYPPDHIRRDSAL